MTIVNTLHKCFIVLCLGTISAVKAGYYTREINLSDDFEVTFVAQELFFKENKVTDRKTGVSRDMTVEERQQELVRAKAEVFNKASDCNIILVCISVKENKIYGILHCQSGKRRPGMVEFKKSRVLCDTSFFKFWQTSNFDLIMQSMTQYAEAFYKGKCMSIAIHVMSKDDASFYTKHGYRILTPEQANDLYYTTTDNVRFLVMALFLPIWALGQACDWGIFYKELL